MLSYLMALYIPPVAMIITFIILFGKFLITIFSLIVPLFEIVISVFLNPVKLANDIIIGITLGFTFLFEALIGELTPGKYLGTASGDNAQEKLDNIEKKCYSTSFMNILILILCPPLAIFMNGGFSRFLEVIICTVLTVYTYYFPGLIYAIIATTHYKNKGEQKSC